MIRRFLQNLYNNFLEEQTRWIALVPILFGLGIGLYFSLQFEPKYWISLVVLELLLFVFYLVRRHISFHLPLYALMLITLGFANAQLHTVYQSRHVESINDVNTYILGKISDISLSSKGKIRYTLESASDFDKPLKGKFRLTSMSKDNNFAVGDCVETAAKLLSAPQIPLKNSYDLSRKYFFDGLSATGYTLGDTFKITCPANLKTSNFMAEVNAFRQKIAERINKLLPIAEAGVIDAVLIGEKSYIPQQITDDYRNSGLAHFLAVSGLHLGTIAGLIFFLLRWIISLFPQIALRYDSKKIAAVIAIFFSFLYLLISGMAIPAQRAFIMTTTVLVGVIFNRQAISLRMVSFAALMVLIISPFALVSVSFQMSFAAVTALVVFYEKFATKISAWSYDKGFIFKTLYYLIGIVVCDLVASIATAPFAIYHFQRLALYTSLGNLLAGPLIAFWIMPCILLSLMVLPFGLLVYPLKLLALGINLLNHITAYVANLPGSVLYIHSLAFGGFMLIVCGAIWLCIWQKNWRYFGLTAIIAGFLTMFNKPLPDAIISFDGKGIALRDNKDKLLLVPLGKTNNFAKEIWKENFNLTVPDKKEQKILKQTISGKKNRYDNIDITCDNKGNCVYKNILKFKTDGKIFLQDKEIDKKFGAYIYLSNGAYFEPLIEPSCRPWQNCNK